MACEKCKPFGSPLSTIADVHNVYKNETPNLSHYIHVFQITGGGSIAKIRVESACDDAINRGEFNVNFCYNCGDDLRLKVK